MIPAVLLVLTGGAAGEGNPVPANSQVSSGLVLKPGEFYFRVDGTQRFLLGRNPTGWQVSQFAPLFRWASQAGERIARIHLMNGMAASAPAGQVDEEWAKRWDQVLDMAAKEGIHVLPVFAAWANWSIKGANEWQHWGVNPYNEKLGGPAKLPVELFQDTACRKLFLGWLEQMVRRWQGRWNIAGWEIFSELDLVSDSKEAAAVEFVEAAAAVIRAADPRQRPVTASLAGIIEWPAVFSSDAVDIVQIHPYSRPHYDGNLCDMIIETVRERLRRYGKPVMIGESGVFLDANEAATALRAEIGARQAVWAAAVSGALIGRMFWWEDGYDQYVKLDLRTTYKDVSSPVARFVDGVDCGGFVPIKVLDAKELRGAAVGNSEVLLGWFRDLRCGYPGWPLREMTGKSVSLEVAGDAKRWKVVFYDTATGETIGKRFVCAKVGKVTVPLPSFHGSIAFRMSSR